MACDSDPDGDPWVELLRNIQELPTTCQAIHLRRRHRRKRQLEGSENVPGLF